MSRKAPCEPKDCQDFKQAQKQKYVQQEPDYCYDPVCSDAFAKRVDNVQDLYQDFTNIENSINRPSRSGKRPSVRPPERESEIPQINIACPDPECGNAHAKTLRAMEMLNDEMIAIEKTTKKRPMNTKDVFDELLTIQMKAEKDTNGNKCRDPVCSNEHEKKVVDLTTGVNALEDILKNMTGLCRQPNCPDIIQKPPKPNNIKSFIEEMPPLPVPNRYTISNNDFKQKIDDCGKKTDENKMFKELADPKTCKGPKCYSAYMGYTYGAEPGKGENLCSNPTCLPFPKSTADKKLCGTPVCPFNKPKFDYGFGDALKPLNTGNLFDLDKPCDFKTCPIGTSGKDTNNFSSFPPAGAAGSTPCGQNKCPYTFDSKPTDFGASADPYSGPPKVGLCGRNSCPYASIVPNAQPIGRGGAPPCGAPACPFTEPKYEPTGLCGQPNCPLMYNHSPGSLKPCPYAGQIKRYPCGSPSCPYVNPSGMLRTHEYQNDKSFVQEAARPYAGSASPYDYMSSLNTSYPSPYATNYSLFSYTDPPESNPCPYMPKSSKKSCGSPKCPYGAKGKTPTDNFCISQTCRFEQGLGDTKFSCNTSESAASTECPLCHAKSKKKDPCANESCPYAEGICGKPKKFSCDYPGNEPCDNKQCPIHQDKNNCPPTCPFSIGMCGGPKVYSCDSPDVQPCESPECPNEKKKKKICKCCGKPKKAKSCLDSVSSEQSNKNNCPKSCPFSTGVCGGPRIYSCDNPDVMPCGTEECPVTAKRKKCKCCGKRKNPTKNPCSCSGEPDDFGSQESSYPQSDDCSCGKKKNKHKLKTCPFANNGGGDDKCGSKTCPFLARLVFCDDCGGVLPDELNSCCTCSGSSVTDASGENNEKKDNEPHRDPSKQGARESNASALVPVDKDKDKKEKKKDKDKEKDKKDEITSLYDYPGVQIGHKDCRYRRKKIPKNMGWLWNIVPSCGKPEFWRGYKPGAILKSVYRIMKKHRDSFDPLHLKKKKSKRVIEDRHCIEVKKKDGEFNITVNPIKDPKTRNPIQSPYMDVTPLKFTVGKEQDEATAFCPCDILEEERLSCANSDFDFHFSPPAAIQDPIPKPKKPKAEISVQYDVNDLSASLRKKLGGSGKKKGGGGGKGKGKKK